MHFNLLSTLILTVGFSSLCKADTIVAFNGNECDGDEGATVPCDGSCHQFAGRHSVFINGGSQHCVTYFENNACQFQESLGGASILNGNSCANVNTGGPVNSFLCAPSVTCEV
ncbi:hypothetical protein CPC08DRAFT_674203 [Agrocybe pediades]|nr:hypothetical protein CPC08DRAFT_674203 [Agrocybe pediades]